MKPEYAATAWPRDLKIFALCSALWGLGLVARILYAGGLLDFMPDTRLQAVIGGLKFYGETARIVLVMQAAIFIAFATAILAERRWGLVLALGYMVEVVASHLAFVIGYMDDPAQSVHVRTAALQGPVAVLILLYLWIRSRDLLTG